MTGGMKLVLSRRNTQKTAIAAVIMSFFVLSDYATLVYVVKIAAILLLLLTERRVRGGAYLRWIAGFLAISAASILWAADRGNALFYLAWILQAVGLALAIENSIHGQADIEYILRCFIVAGLALMVRMLMSTSLSALGSFRLGNMRGFNANEIALKASIACISAFYQYTRSRRRGQRIGLMTATVLLALFVFLTGSRKGTVMVLAGIVLYNLVRSGSWVRYLRNILISALIVAAFLIVVTRVEALNNVLGARLIRLLNMFDADADTAAIGNSISNRLDFISIGMDLFRDRPLFGYGLGNYQNVSGLNLYAHNNYVELLVDLGLVGTAIYYTIYASNIVNILRIIRRRRELLAVMLAFSAMLLVVEYGLVTFQSDYVQIIIALSYAAVRVVRAESAGGGATQKRRSAA